MSSTSARAESVDGADLGTVGGCQLGSPTGKGKMAIRSGMAQIAGMFGLCARALLAAPVAGVVPGGAAAAEVLVMGLPVPTVTVFAGDVMAKDLLTTKRFRVKSSIASSYVRSIDSAVGLAARRTLVAGRPIPVNSLAAPFVVREGTRVRILFRSNGIEISAAGLALQSGGEGDVVGVRNVDSGRTVRGVVSADGRVIVGGAP